MALGGYQGLLKIQIPRKRVYSDTAETTWKRICEKLGEDEAENMREEFKHESEEEKDGMIKTLLTEGKSQVEVKVLFKCGGYKLDRIAQELKKPPEERGQKEKYVPKHALSDDDKGRIRDHIQSYDLEPGYPCAHREPLLYFHSA